MNRRALIPALLPALAVCVGMATPLFAAAAELKTEVFVEKTVPGLNGAAPRTVLQPAGRATPGDQVVYVITYRNDADKPAEHVAITNPLAANLTYLGSTDGPTPLVSVDGQTFAALSQLSVRGPDGAPAPARTGDVSALRWSLAQALPAGAQARFTFRAMLK